MAYGIFKDIERLVEYVPIEISSGGLGKLSEMVDIDTEFYFEDTDRIAVRLGILQLGKNTLRVRDIIRLLNKFLKDASVINFVESPPKYLALLDSGSGIPLKNLLFEFSLSALNGDSFDAKINLMHSYHILGLRRSLVLLLSVIVNEYESLKYDSDVRQLLTQFALISEPDNIDIHFNADETGFSKRYSNYLGELQKLSHTYHRMNQYMCNR
jgi:hypothetical protein